MTLQLPSGNVVLVVRLAGREAACEYTAWSARKGEITFTQAWLSRFSVVLTRPGR